MQKIIISSEYFSRPNPVVAADTDCPGTRSGAEHRRPVSTNIFAREHKWEKIDKTAWYQAKWTEIMKNSQKFSGLPSTCLIALPPML